MIFVTVGTQFPFDRMVKTVDEWAKNNQNEEVVGQIGPSDYLPKHFRNFNFLTPHEIEEYFKQSSLVIAHGGMGSILTCLRLKKPIIIMPRLFKFNEHRNDHQLYSTKQFSNIHGVYVANDEYELLNLLNRKHDLTANEGIGSFASFELIKNIENFVNKI